MSEVVNDMTEALETPPIETAPRSRPVWLVGVVGVIALVVLCAFSLPFLNVLFTIVNVPRPPLPPGLNEIRHENYDYGVDEWWYTSDNDPCQFVAFYEARGLLCNTTPLQCNRGDDFSGGNFSAVSPLVSRCTGGNENLGLFSMDYWVIVTRDQTDPRKGGLDVWRSINWLSGVTPTPQP